MLMSESDSDIKFMSDSGCQNWQPIFLLDLTFLPKSISQQWQSETSMAFFNGTTHVLAGFNILAQQVHRHKGSP